jgi:hypothetical protein
MILAAPAILVADVVIVFRRRRVLRRVAGGSHEVTR